MTDPSTQAPTAVAAAYFDGRSSARRDVLLAVTGGEVVLTGEDIARREPLSNVRLSERMGAAPRLVTFADGAFCEVRDHATFDRLLAASGYRESPVVRMQSSWRWATGAIVTCVAGLVFAYFVGVPWLAEFVARRTPAAVTAKLSDMSLEFFDRGFLQASKLPEARREALARKFARLAPPDGDAVSHRVLFRKGGGIGANAFALPSGTIVVTDELVGLAGDDNEILAVLTHELGHVHERHGLRLVLESSIVGLVATWYLGDFSSLAAGVPATLLQARYSRGHEGEADAYGARMLKANGMSPMLLATMLEKLERSHEAPVGDAGECKPEIDPDLMADSKPDSKPESRPASKPASKPDAAPTPVPDKKRGVSVLGYLASHPATEARIAALRAMDSRSDSRSDSRPDSRPDSR